MTGGADLIVIGASAGGLEPLSTIVGRLPRSFKGCVLIVVHSSPSGAGRLPKILQRNAALPVAFARDRSALTPGRIFVAPADVHLLVVNGRLSLGRGPKENGFRPAIDPLFRTAARDRGSRVIGVVLSGALRDGTFGLSAIKAAGGVTIVQDPDEAAVSSMPLSAIGEVEVDHVVSAADIAALLVRLTSTIRAREGVRSTTRQKLGEDPQVAREPAEVREMTGAFGPPSGLTCPDCGGALWEIEDGHVVRYQCHVGHQYAPGSLDNGQREVFESAMWSAIRALDEHAELKLRSAKRAEDNGFAAVSAEFKAGARKARSDARRIRSVLLSVGEDHSTPRRQRQAGKG